MKNGGRWTRACVCVCGGAGGERKSGNAGVRRRPHASSQERGCALLFNRRSPSPLSLLLLPFPHAHQLHAVSTHGGGRVGAQAKERKQHHTKTHLRCVSRKNAPGGGRQGRGSACGAGVHKRATAPYARRTVSFVRGGSAQSATQKTQERRLALGAAQKHACGFRGAARCPAGLCCTSLPSTMLTSTLRRLAPSLAASLRPTPLSASVARAGVTSTAVHAHGGGDSSEDKDKET